MFLTFVVFNFVTKVYKGYSESERREENKRKLKEAKQKADDWYRIREYERKLRKKMESIQILLARLTELE